MDYSAQRTLLEAIKSDDLATFNRFAGSRVGTFRMGKFPILSLIFLYGAQKIAKTYESAFMKYNNWEELPLLAEIPAKFASVAGKCLLIYSGDEVVTPIEMLLILGKRNKVKTHYALISVSTAQKSRLQAIYYKQYGLEITFDGDEIIIPNPPLNYYAKRRLILSIIASVLSVALIISTPFVVNIFHPFIGGNERLDPEPDPDTPDVPDVPTDQPQTYEVNDFTNVDFGSKNTYILLNDVVLPADYRVEQVFCNIEGNGKTVAFTPGQTLFKENYGVIKDVNFVGSGDVAVTDNYAFVVGSNYGEINNVSLTYSGNITVPAKEGENNGTRIASVAVNNLTYVKENKTVLGQMKGITVTLNAQITGDHTANASFAGVVSNNASVVEECTSNGSVVADTCDLAGICADNTYYLNKNVNRADLEQTTSSGQWNPLCAGIVINNKIANIVVPKIEECVNYGKVTSRSTYDSGAPFEEDHRFCQAMATGVAGNNEGVISKCDNNGLVTADSKECVTVSAGICAFSYSNLYKPNIADCVNRGIISSHAVNITAICGGVCGVATSNQITSCGNEGAVTCSIDNCAYDNADSVVGGIVANGNGSDVVACNNSGNVTVNNVIKAIYVGGIAGVAYRIQRCTNDCDITVTAGSDQVFTGGIAGLTGGNTTSVRSEGDVTVSASDATVYLGGVIGRTYYTVDTSYFAGAISANAAKKLYLGGVLGCGDITESGIYVYCGSVYNSITDAVINATASEYGYVGGTVGSVPDKTYNEGQDNETFFGGKIKNCFALGTVGGNDKCRIGALAGLVGKRIYDANETAQNKNFDGAYYTTDTVTAFGGNVSGETIDDAPDLTTTIQNTRSAIESNETYQAILNALS